MTTTELRVLYLLHKHDSPAPLSHLSQQMSRHKFSDRDTTLKNLEDFGLISSCKAPGRSKIGETRKGRSPLMYWLTDAGKEMVVEMVKKGELADHTKERRGTRYA